MPEPIGPRQIEHEHVAGLESVRALIAAIAAGSVRNTFAGPVKRYTPSASTTDGSIAVLLITAPSGARLPLGKHTVDVRPRARRLVGRHDDVVGIDAVAFLQQRAEPRAPLGRSPTGRAVRRA